MLLKNKSVQMLSLTTGIVTTIKQRLLVKQIETEFRIPKAKKKNLKNCNTKKHKNYRR